MRVSLGRRRRGAWPASCSSNLSATALLFPSHTERRRRGAWPTSCSALTRVLTGVPQTSLSQEARRVAYFLFHNLRASRRRAWVQQSGAALEAGSRPCMSGPPPGLQHACATLLSLLRSDMPAVSAAPAAPALPAVPQTWRTFCRRRRRRRRSGGAAYTMLSRHSALACRPRRSQPARATGAAAAALAAWPAAPPHQRWPWLPTMVLLPPSWHHRYLDIDGNGQISQAEVRDSVAKIFQVRGRGAAGARGGRCGGRARLPLPALEVRHRGPRLFMPAGRQSQRARASNRRSHPSAARRSACTWRARWRTPRA